MSFAFAQLGYNSRKAFETAFPGEVFYDGYMSNHPKGTPDDAGYYWDGSMASGGVNPMTGVYAPSDIGKYIGGNKPVYTKMVPYMDPNGTFDPTGVGASGVFTSAKAGGTAFVQTGRAVPSPMPTPPANFIPPPSVYATPVKTNPASSMAPTTAGNMGLNVNRIAVDSQAVRPRSGVMPGPQGPQILPTNVTVASRIQQPNWTLWLLIAAGLFLVYKMGHHHHRHH